MKRFCNIFALIALLLMNCSCVEETQIELSQDVLSDYDIKVMSLAKAVNAAIRENPDYRCLIKNEVSKQFDGDYDYLFSTSMKHNVSPSEDLITKSGYDEVITVKELLSYYFDPSDFRTKSSLDVLDEIIKEYPDLQISIPVHAEEWDPDNYTPSVAIIPEDCEYPFTKILPGIDAEGNQIEIDAINEPDVPVIVIGLNERIDEPPVITLDNSPLIQVEMGSVYLQGAYLNDAVRLVYTLSNVKTVHSVYIYRTLPNSSMYNLIYNGTPMMNQYNDWDIEVLKEYSYYIVVDCTVANGLVDQRKSLTSNVVTVVINGEIPDPVLNLRSVNEYSTKNFITWNNPVPSKFPTQIFKTTPNITDSLIATLQPTETYYYDEPVVKGEKWVYLLKKYNPNTGEVSSHEKTFVYNPYRNPSAESKVKVRKIHLDRNQIEGWFEGRPELYITTYGHLKKANGDIVVDTLSHFSYRFPAGSYGDSPELTSVLADWSFFDDSYYYPVINIHVVEYDRSSSNLDISANAKIGVKLSEDIGLESKGRFNFVLSNSGQDCGIAYLRYYQNPCDTLFFPACGLKFVLSE